jgi:hypothetical protein
MGHLYPRFHEREMPCIFTLVCILSIPSATMQSPFEFLQSFSASSSSDEETPTASASSSSSQRVVVGFSPAHKGPWSPNSVLPEHHEPAQKPLSRQSSLAEALHRPQQAPLQPLGRKLSIKINSGGRGIQLQLHRAKSTGLGLLPAGQQHAGGEAGATESCGQLPSTARSGGGPQPAVICRQASANVEIPRYVYEAANQCTPPRRPCMPQPNSRTSTVMDSSKSSTKMLMGHIARPPASCLKIEI